MKSSLWVWPLQVRGGMQFPPNEAHDIAALCPVAFVSKKLLRAEMRQSDIEREALGTPHSLEKFHNYWFAHEVTMITDHKPLVAIIKNGSPVTEIAVNPDMHTLIQNKHHIRPELQLYVTDQLSRQNNDENKD